MLGLEKWLDKLRPELLQTETSGKPVEGNPETCTGQGGAGKHTEISRSGKDT